MLPRPIVTSYAALAILSMASAIQPDLGLMPAREATSGSASAAVAGTAAPPPAVPGTAAPDAAVPDAAVPGTVVPGGAATPYPQSGIPQPRPVLPETIVSLSGLLPAIALLRFGIARSHKASTNVPEMSSPSWTAQSWSSNLAIGGTLLAQVLAISALPAYPHYLARSSYTVLNLFFAALVGFAPSVYGLLKVGGPATKPRALRLFAVAAAITLWSTVGELAMVAVLFLEIARAGAMSWTSAVAAATMVGMVALIVVRYGFRAVMSYTTPTLPVAPDIAGQPPRSALAPREWAIL